MSLETRLLRRLPRGLRRPVRRLIHLPVDTVDRVLGRRPALQPPRGLSYVGAGDAAAVGEEFLGYFRRLGGLTADDRVLDIGCGIGRMAVPLTRVLSGGGYDGFDISRADIGWCRKHISSRFPEFRFHYADVYNSEYNWRGRTPASELEFPFPGAAFSFAFATSVFTHFLSAALERYLDEAARVLAPGGRLCATFFLLNPESEAMMAAGHCGLQFQHRKGAARVHDLENPEGAVAYEERFVRSALAERGFAVVEPLRYGSWCGRREFLSYQDLGVAVRDARPPGPGSRSR